MKKNLEKSELRRNIFHILIGIIIVAFINIYSVQLSLLVLAVIIILGLFISLLSKAVSVPVISWFLENFDRPEDIKRFPGKGALFFFLGSAATLYLFGIQIASASILILAIGDSLNILVGKPFGRVTNPLNSRKMIEGSFAGFVGGFIAASFFVPWMPAMIAAAVAMIVEMIDFKEMQVNDNILVPLFSGLVLYLIL